MFAVPVLAAAIAADPTPGTYTTSSQVVTVGALDTSSQKMHVYWPSNAKAGEKFPLISYLHGLAGGGVDIVAYGKLFGDMASYGFVVAAPAGCGEGCKDKVNAPYTTCGGLPDVAPAGWSSFYGEQLKTIEYAKNQSAGPVFGLVDWAAGVGIAGHSMGGQATTIASAAACAKQWNIKAAALHHPANGATPTGNIGVGAAVPLAAFTSDGDSIWPETHDIYYNSTVVPRVYRDQVGFSHLEPLNVLGSYNPWLATMTAAWFNIYLKGDKDQWHAMIYDKSSPTSLCKYAAMAACETVEQ